MQIIIGITFFKSLCEAAHCTADPQLFPALWFFLRHLVQMFRTHLQVVQSVELHQVMESGEGLIGVLEVESGKWRLGVVEDVKVSQFPLLLRLPGDTCV